MSSIRHAPFLGVKGYATYDRAIRRGREVAETIQGMVQHERKSVTWFVIALPNGRFAPCFTGRDINPGWLLGSVNVCMVN